jgi:hypothetical protein
MPANHINTKPAKTALRMRALPIFAARLLVIL